MTAADPADARLRISEVAARLPDAGLAVLALAAETCAAVHDNHPDPLPLTYAQELAEALAVSYSPDGETQAHLPAEHRGYVVVSDPTSGTSGLIDRASLIAVGILPDPREQPPAPAGALTEDTP
jgi:hypothetical protein